MPRDTERSTDPTRRLHQFPFVMVDRCVEAAEGASRATRLVSIDDALLEGRECETLARSLLVEAMAQTAALFAHQSDGGRFGMLVGLKRVRFGPVPRVGDRLLVEASLIQKFGDLVRVEARVSRCGERLAEGEILISLADDAAFAR